MTANERPPMADPVAAGAAAWEAKKAALLDYVTASNDPALMRTMMGMVREISSLQAAERRAEVARQEVAERHQRMLARKDAEIAIAQAAERRTRALLEVARNRLVAHGLPIADLEG